MAVDSNFMTLLETERPDSQDYKEAVHQKNMANMLASYTANNVEVLSESIDNETLTMQQAIMVNSELQIHGLKTLLTEIIALPQPELEAEPSIIEPVSPVNINLSKVMLQSSSSAFSKTSNMMQMSRDDLSFMHDVATLQSNRKNHRYHVSIDSHLLTGTKGIDLLKQNTTKPAYSHLSGEFTRIEQGYLSPYELSNFHPVYQGANFSTTRTKKTYDSLRFFDSAESSVLSAIGVTRDVNPKVLTSSGWHHRSLSDSDLDFTIDKRQYHKPSGAAQGPFFSRLHITHPNTTDLNVIMTAIGYPASNLSLGVATLKKGYKAWSKKLQNSESRLPEDSQLYDYSFHITGKAPLVESSSTLKRSYTGLEVGYFGFFDYTFETVQISEVVSLDDILAGGNNGLLLSDEGTSYAGDNVPNDADPLGSVTFKGNYYRETFYISFNQINNNQFLSLLRYRYYEQFDVFTKVNLASEQINIVNSEWTVKTLGDYEVLEVKIPNSFKRHPQTMHLPSDLLIAQNSDKTGFIDINRHGVDITKVITGVNSQTLEALKQAVILAE